MKAVWLVASATQDLEYRWLHVRYDPAAIQEALAHLRGPYSPREVANWLQQHHGGPAMPKSPTALRVGLQSERTQNALALWVEQGWIGRG